MAQQIINTGAVANDGTGDPLRTAFTETNSNFTEIYTAGPVGSNVRIANNTILTINTNGNLVLAPNGVGVVQSNVNIVPNSSNIRNLGSSTQRWGTVYTQYLNVTNGISGDLTVTGNLVANAVIAPELTVNTIRSDDSTIIKIQDGLEVDGDLSAATVTTPELTVNTIRSDDSTVVNIQDGVEVDGDILANGNVTADYVLGDGSQLLNIPVGNNGAVQVAWLGKFSNQGGTPDDTYSTLQFDSDGMPTLDGTSAYQQRVDYSPYLQVLAPEVESTDYDIVAGPGITVVGYDDNYNTPRSAYLSVQDQANATQQWDFGILGNGSNAFSIQNRTASTIPLVISTDGAVTASTIITNDISSDDSSFVTIQDGLNVVGDIETRGNVTADYFIGNGSQLTGLAATYGNANVVTLLAGFGNNTVSTTGNVSGGYLFGNGSQLTGLPATYGNANVVANLAALGSNPVSSTGNITAGNVLTGGVISATGNITGGNISTGIITLTNGAVIRDTAGDAVAVGSGAGNSNQGIYGVAIGFEAGQTTQGNSAVAVGENAGYNTQGISAVAVGDGAGRDTQGQYAVAVGYGAGNSNQANNSIILNATGSVLEQTTANTFTVAPVRNDVANTGQVVFYNTTSKEVTYGNAIGVAGNVTGAYVKGNGSELTNLPAPTVAQDIASTGDMSIMTYDGNLKYVNYATVEPSTGNIKSAGVISATGNVIGGNIRTAGLISATGNVIAGNISATGNITGASDISATGNITGNTAGFAIGYRDIPQVSFTANTTIATIDAGKHYYSTLSTGNVLTIANNASQGFQVGAAISIVNQGTGNITVAQGSGVTLYFAGNATSGNRTVATYGMATIMKVDTNTWFINGTGVS